MGSEVTSLVVIHCLAEATYIDTVHVTIISTPSHIISGMAPFHTLPDGNRLLKSTSVSVVHIMDLDSMADTGGACFSMWLLSAAACVV